MIVILDNGHGNNTAGKRSPKWNDGTQLFEYEFNRDVVSRIAVALSAIGIKYKILVPELNDISLGERCRRANAVYAQDKNSFLLSIHANAGGGTGWEVYTTRGKTKSDAYATIFFDEVQKEFPNEKMRKDMSDGDVDREANFYIIANTKCPAILTENFFMDNETDCKKLLDGKFRQRIADAHVRAIKRIADSLKK